MRRVTVAIGVTLALLTPTVASSHPTTTFDACVTYRHSDFRCSNRRVEAGDGTQVRLRAKLVPRHAGDVAWVKRLEPHADSWERVGQVTVSDEGRVHWLWVPTDQDVRNNTSWRFRFKIPGHGRSDIVRVRVRSDDF